MNGAICVQRVGFGFKSGLELRTKWTDDETKAKTTVHIIQYQVVGLQNIYEVFSVMLLLGW